MIDLETADIDIPLAGTDRCARVALCFLAGGKPTSAAIVVDGPRPRLYTVGSAASGFDTGKRVQKRERDAGFPGCLTRRAVTKARRCMHRSGDMKGQAKDKGTARDQVRDGRSAQFYPSEKDSFDPNPAHCLVIIA